MSAKTKPITPYQRLLESAKHFASRVKYRHRKTMWVYGKTQLPDLYERVAAAKQLGYDVMLFAEQDGLHVKYVKEVEEAPWEFRS